ncbi:MAG: hypothetical protein Q8N99_07840 [Nanoarchaeota archaeon]|nr:hypothetical protein [Nanoarchaeota archaeon]
MATRFSSKYPAFSSWLHSKRRISSYSERVIKLHKIFPNEPLVSLIKTSIKILDLSRRPWEILLPEEKSNRILALEVLRRMKKGESLTRASKDVGLTKYDILTYLRNALSKSSRGWYPKQIDHIERAMQIYEKGEIRTIIVTNSRDASIIGEYFATVKKYLESGDPSVLKKFKKIVILDAYGKKHKLETNPDKIRDIEEAKEDSEFFEVYSDE